MNWLRRKRTGKSVFTDQFAEADGFFRIRKGVDLVDEITVSQVFPVQHGGDVLRPDDPVRCNAGQGGEQVRAVAGFGNRFPDAGRADEADGQVGTGGNDRFPWAVGFEREAFGSVGFHKDMVRFLQQGFKRNDRRRIGQFPGRLRTPQADDPAAGQGGAELTQHLLPVFRGCIHERDLREGPDVCGRGEDSHRRNVVFPPLPITEMRLPSGRNSSKGLYIQVSFLPFMIIIVQERRLVYARFL